MVRSLQFSARLPKFSVVRVELAAACGLIGRTGQKKNADKRAVIRYEKRGI
jgi:hypothetical protein